MPELCVHNIRADICTNCEPIEHNGIEGSSTRLRALDETEIVRDVFNENQRLRAELQAAYTALDRIRRTADKFRMLR